MSTGHHATITGQLGSLLEFAEKRNWNVEQHIWNAPGEEPTTHRGTCHCRALFGGLCIEMITEIESAGYHGISLFTHNVSGNQLELAYFDTFSDEGITLMTGSVDGGPSRDEIRSAFSQQATQESLWSTAITAGGACIPSATASALVAARPAAAAIETRPAAPGGAESLPLRLVTNRISENHWVLDFFAPGPDGNEFLVQQNIFTRG